MSDTIVTFHGWVGADVRHRTPQGTSVATLRVAVTPRVKRGSSWTDGETTWYTVTAWRTLADHVRDSVRKGDAVIVHGRLRTETWHPENGPASTSFHVEASYLGHDLTRGTSTFTKSLRPAAAEPDVDLEVAEMIHEMAADSPPLTSWGEPAVASGDGAAARAGESAA